MCGQGHNTTAVYIFRFPDHRHYTGITNNLARRWKEHLHNKCKSTRHKGFPILVYFKSFSNRSTAAHIERYIKNISAKRFLRISLQRHKSLR